jgi:hypothetical protein
MEENMSRHRYSSPAALLLLLLASAGCVEGPTPLEEGLRPQAARVPGTDIIAVQNRYTPGLLRREGIIGTGIRLSGTGEQSIAVYALTPGHAAAARIPERLEGFGVNVVVTGRILATDYNDPTTGQRPAPNGFSIGHYAITAGTIGARVTDGTHAYILSNNHVLANSNNGRAGDPIYQPGPYDGGTAADQIGTLADFQPINMSMFATNTMDAAIALVDAGDVLGTTPTYAYGAPGTTPAAATLDMAVKKFGRTTGLTHGTVSEVNATIEVCYIVFYNLCLESAYFNGQIGIAPGTFSGGGDSGSLIVTDDASNSPVGLLFAGSSTRTFANPIAPVLARFGVTIDAGGNPPGPTDTQAPVVSFARACVKATCTFTDQSTDNVGVVAWSWTFGNRKTATLQNPSTTYSKAGTYTVTLTARDAAGNTGTATGTVSCTKTGKTPNCV